MLRSRAPSARANSKRARTGSKSLVTKKTFPLKYNPVPPKFVTTVRYADIFNLTITAGAFANQVYSCNGLFDPDITGTGHQPMYFDNLIALYQHYNVRSSKITVRGCVAEADLTALSMMIRVDDNSSLVTNSATAMAELPGQDTPFVVTNTGHDPVPVLKASWRAKDIFPGNDIANLQGTSSANPTEQSYYIIGAQDYALNNLVVTCAVLIEFQVEWSEYKSVAQS